MAFVLWHSSGCLLCLFPSLHKKMSELVSLWWWFSCGLLLDSVCSLLGAQVSHNDYFPLTSCREKVFVNKSGPQGSILRSLYSFKMTPCIVTRRNIERLEAKDGETVIGDTTFVYRTGNLE